MSSLSMEHLSRAIAELESKQNQTQTDETCVMACKKVMDLATVLKEKDISIHRLRQMVFGKKTEKSKETSSASGKSTNRNPKQRESGRLKVSDYQNADAVTCPHGTLKPGAQCPECERGKVYPYQQAEEIIIEGQAPFKATRLELERLRCNACGFLFTADRPSWAPPGKYGDSAIAMLALLKYGYGMPYNRLDQLQACMKTPFPSSTQWDCILGLKPLVDSVFQAMVVEASQWPLFYADDTGVKILSEMNESTREVDAKHQGTQTTVIVAVKEGRKAVCFFSGYNHAGDNIGELLSHRNQELGAPIQMTDALPANMSHDVDVKTSLCLVHARRNFYEIQNYYPAECGLVLKVFKALHKHDTICQEEALSPAQRLRYHQVHSKKLMDHLKKWCDRQFERRLTEPNSSLGKAIQYLQNHWEELTLFLREEGVPLDNNEAERQLKRAILNRKNAYFFKTQKGAKTGSQIMSLIVTCEENGINPFDYLVLLQREARQVGNHPERYLPWQVQHHDDGLTTCYDTFLQSLAIPAC